MAIKASIFLRMDGHGFMVYQAKKMFMSVITREKEGDVKVGWLQDTWFSLIGVPKEKPKQRRSSRKSLEQIMTDISRPAVVTHEDIQKWQEAHEKGYDYKP